MLSSPVLLRAVLAKLLCNTGFLQLAEKAVFLYEKKDAARGIFCTDKADHLSMH